MSVRHIAAVLEMPLEPGPKLVALVYANSANDEDDLAWLSVEKVALRSGYSERQTQTLIRRLTTLGVLAPVPLDALPPGARDRIKGIPRTRVPTVYRMDLGVQISHPKIGLGVQSAQPRGAVHDISGVKPTAPKPEEEPESKPRWWDELRYSPGAGWEPIPGRAHRWRTPSGPETPSGVVDLLWEAVVDVCRLDMTSVPATARGVINRSVEELRRAGADPREVQDRAARYLSGTAGIPRGAKLTHRALVVHWPALAAPTPRGPVADPDAKPYCPPHRYAVDAVDDRGRYCVSCKTFETDHREEADARR